LDSASCPLDRLIDPACVLDCRDKADDLKEHGRALIEAVGDLGQLRQKRFEVLMLLLKVHGLDASPIQLLAIEDEEGTES
jgi:kynurenine formamidase